MATSSLLNFTVPLGLDGQPSSSQGLLFPKLKQRFRAYFINFGVSVSTTELTKQVMTFKKPTVSFNEQVLNVYNSKVKYAGKYSWDDASVELRDDAQGNVSQLVGEQLQKQLDFQNQSSAASASDYKFSILYQVLDGGNGAAEPLVIEEWTLMGCYLSKADYGNSDYADEGTPMTITLTIPFDNALQTPATSGVGFPITRTHGTLATGS